MSPAPTPTSTRRERLNYLPLDQARTAADGSTVYADRHWIIVPETIPGVPHGLVFYGRSPQCNHSPEPVDRLLASHYADLGAEVRHIPLVFIPPAYLPEW